MARRQLGNVGSDATSRTPRRVLGVHIDADVPSETLSRDPSPDSTAADDGGTGTPVGSDSQLWFTRHVRQERDGSQDVLGEVISDWVPAGEVTAIELKVQSVTQEREGKWANGRVWVAEFEPDCVEPSDMLINRDGDKFTVQTVTPKIEGGIVTREKAMMSERVELYG